MKHRIKDWRDVSLVLAFTGALSWRRIAVAVNAPRTTVSDFLRKHYKGV